MTMTMSMTRTIAVRNCFEDDDKCKSMTISTI